MEVLRTPDERFASLSGFPFVARHVTVQAEDGPPVRMGYVEDGPPGGPPVLLLHGEPSWSYLYRKMLPPLAAAGLRAIAPDLIGFGRSDKPAARGDYTYARHVAWVRGLLDALALREITLVCQDWGGLIGLRLLGEQPDRFARAVAANTFLPTGDRAPSPAFLAWREFSQTVPDFVASQVVCMGCKTPPQADVLAAYDAPFPDERYKAGARQFPALVPIAPDDPASAANRAAWEGLRSFRKPFLTAFSDSDPITRGADRVLQKEIPGAAGRPHTTIRNAGHFLQEDQGEALAQVVIDLVRATA